MNRCADMLARMGSDQDLGFISFDSLPVDVINVFEEDFNGMYSNKLCPELSVVPQFLSMHHLLTKNIYGGFQIQIVFGLTMINL